MGHIELFFGFSLALFGIAFTVIAILTAQNERTKIGAAGVGMILVATGFFIGRGGLGVASSPMAPSVATFMFIAIFGGLALLVASLIPSRRRKKDEVN